MIKITIIIPTYKRPDFMMEALVSCLNQTYAAYEILIGDDSPDEATANAVKALAQTSGPLIRYIHNRPALGQARNVNMLFRRAEGDKIMLLHDDDLLLPNALETLVNCFIANPAVSVAYGRQYIITDDGTVSEPRSVLFNDAFYRTEAYAGSRLTPLEAGMVQQFPNNAYLINKECAQRIGYREVGDVCDFDFGFRVGQAGEPMCFVNQYTAKYRISATAVSTGKLNNAGLTSYLMVKQADVPSASQSLKNKWLRSRAAVAVGQAIATGQFKTAARIYFSKDHFSKILTPGGVKRLLNLLLWGRFTI